MNTMAPPFSQLCHQVPWLPDSGIYTNIYREAYDNIAAMSATVLKTWMRTDRVPSKFKWWLDHRWEEQRSPALVLGDALDCKVLTPAEFIHRFCCVPADAPKRPSKMQLNAKKPSPETLQAIGYWNAFNEENKDKVVLTPEQMEAVNGMEKSVLQSESTHGVFENCTKAVLVGEIWNYPAKAEIDLWDGGSTHIIDLKSALDASPSGFGVAVARYGYLEQAIWYLMLARALGFEKLQFTWIVVESEVPHVMQVYTLDPSLVVKHSEIYAATLSRMMDAFSSLVDALEDQDYKDPVDWQPLELPAWYLSQNRIYPE